MKKLLFFLCVLTSSFNVFSQIIQYDQLILGDKNDMPSFVNLWIEGSPNPQVLFNSVNAEVDQKLWAVSVINDEFRIFAEKDDFSQINNALVIKRGIGLGIDNISFPNGNVGIGTNNPDAKLAVNGDIHTQEVRVDLKDWPDYVFKEGYELPTLKEVENHIAQKGYLINIPSVTEVTENGIELGKMGCTTNFRLCYILA